MLRRIVGLPIVSCCILESLCAPALAQQPATPSGGAAPRRAAPQPMEDRRPPLFLKETFPMPKKEEIYISQSNISAPA